MATEDRGDSGKEGDDRSKPNHINNYIKCKWFKHLKRQRL